MTDEFTRIPIKLLLNGEHNIEFENNCVLWSWSYFRSEQF